MSERQPEERPATSLLLDREIAECEHIIELNIKNQITDKPWIIMPPTSQYRLGDDEQWKVIRDKVWQDRRDILSGKKPEDERERETPPLATIFAEAEKVKRGAGRKPTSVSRALQNLVRPKEVKS